MKMCPIFDPILSPLDPLLMNAFNTVNMAAACMLTSVDFARKLGIPESHWIYPIGGAGKDDHNQGASTRICRSKFSARSLNY